MPSLRFLQRPTERCFLLGTRLPLYGRSGCNVCRSLESRRWLPILSLPASLVWSHGANSPGNALSCQNECPSPCGFQRFPSPLSYCHLGYQNENDICGPRAQRVRICSWHFGSQEPHGPMWPEELLLSSNRRVWSPNNNKIKLNCPVDISYPSFFSSLREIQFPYHSSSLSTPTCCLLHNQHPHLQNEPFVTVHYNYTLSLKFKVDMKIHS